MPDALTEILAYAESQRGVPYQWGETKDITSASGGQFTVPAFGSGALTRPNIIATPVENALRNMVTVHNSLHGSDPAKHAHMSAVRAVYRRGAKAYSKRRHPASSRRRWAMQRVHSHLSMLASGQRPHSRYVHDDDLLPAAHPLAKSTKGERKALLIAEGRPAELGYGAPVSVQVAAFLLEGKGFLDALGSLEVKGVWDPDKHPRDFHGRFIHIGAAVTAMIDGKQQTGTVTAVGGGGVRVRTADGAEHAVKAAETQVTDHVGPHLSVLEQAAAHSDASRKAAKLTKAGHPEALAWTQRRDALGASLRQRVSNGEDVHAPYAPGEPAATSAPDVSAPDQLGARHVAGAPAVPTGGGPGAAATRPDGTAWGSGYSPGDPRANPDYDRYVANVDAKNDAAIATVGDTQQVHDHVDGIVGAYQPDRQAIHDEIIAELMDDYKHMPRERKAVMLAGPSGAGKSTTIRLLGRQFGVESKDGVGADGKPATVPTNFATVNPDDVKELMIRKGLVDPDRYSRFGLGPAEGMTLIHEESSDIAKRLQDTLIAHGTNILVDGTFSGKLDKNVGKIQKLRASGYKVTGVLVDGDIDRSLTNAGKRHTKIKDGIGPDTSIDPNGTFQGRYVPLDHIEAQRPEGQFSDIMERPHRSNNAENFEAAKEAFNGGIRIYDNSSGASKLVYSEEPPPDTEARSDGLPNEHLDKIRNGTVGKVDSGDLPGVLAHGIHKSVNEGRMHYVQPVSRGGGYGVAGAPSSSRYFELTAGGHVTDMHKDDTSGRIKRKPMPSEDVRKIVDHYVKPKADSGGGDAGARA